MSGFNYTPGPWHTVHQYCDELSITDNDGFEIAEVSRTAILQAWEDKGFGHWGEAGGHKNISQEEQFANAHLIAAAPELLEALQAALEWIDAVPSDTSLPAMPGFDREWVNQVISKATGE